MLIKFQFIKKRIVEKHEIYFSSKVDFQEAKYNFYISLQKSKMIINYLQNSNIGITKTKLSRAIKMHINTLSKYLNILIKINIINKEKIDNQMLYFLEEKFLIQSG